MAKGLPKSYIKKYGISKKAWREYRKSRKKGTRRTRSTRRKSNPKKVRRKLGRRKKSRRRYGMTIPLAPVLGLAAGMAAPIGKLVNGEVQAAIEIATENYTGYNIPSQTWIPTSLARGLLPLAIGLLVHKFVGGPPLNANRMLARAKVPFIRI